MLVVKNEKTGNTLNLSVSKVKKLIKKWVGNLIGFDCYANQGREEPLSLGDCLDLAINGDERFIDFLNVEKIKFTEEDEFILNFMQYNEKELGINLNLHYKLAEGVNYEDVR